MLALLPLVGLRHPFLAVLSKPQSTPTSPLSSLLSDLETFHQSLHHPGSADSALRPSPRSQLSPLTGDTSPKSFQHSCALLTPPRYPFLDGLPHLPTCPVHTAAMESGRSAPSPLPLLRFAAHFDVDCRTAPSSLTRSPPLFFMPNGLVTPSLPLLPFLYTNTFLSA